MPQLSAKILRRQTATGLPVDDELSTPAGIDPYQYAVPEEFDVSSEMSNVVDPMELAAQSKEALGSLQQPREKIDVKQAPDIPMSPTASNKRTFEDISLRPEQELGEQQLLRNYLLSLQKRRDSEGELRDLNAQALDRGRVAMLAEGLSESASKMGNILGTPTGSTMQGFGKEAANLEMTGVDQARKIMQESDPTMELARQAQIAQMMENIRASRAKTATGAAEAQSRAENAATRNAILAGKAPRGAAPPRPAALPKPTAEQSKLRQQEREFNERYTNIQQNLKKMYDMVDKYGTYELMGTFNRDLERMNYNIAIDYAKIVDPESVAREGEVKAAQRYLLPLQPSLEHGYTRPVTAKKIIENMSRELEDRAKSRQKSMRSVYGTSSASEMKAPTAAPAAVTSGNKIYLKALTGDNKVRVFDENTAAQLLQQRQPNGQPMYQRVK